MGVTEFERNKRYRIEVVLGYNGNKKIRHTEMFYGGKKEAVMRENEIKAQVRNNSFVNKNSYTVKNLMEEYLKYNKDKWAPKTYVSNVNWINKINDKIGHIKLQSLNVKILEDFYTYLRTETKYSDKTILHFYTLINGALNKAVQWEYILSNCNTKIEKPKVRKKEIECYSPEEVEELLKALATEPIKYQAIIMLALDSGIRRGELTGLTWEDVDFKNGTININKTTQYIKELGIFEKETKSATSDRIIYITKATLNILRRYHKEQLERRILLGSKWQNSKRVFTTDYGADMHPDTPSQIFEKIIKRHNLKKISFHGIRHTSISLLINEGIQVQVISKRAGHSSVGITHSTYSHFFENEFKEVANKLDTFLCVNS